MSEPLFDPFPRVLPLPLTALLPSFIRSTDGRRVGLSFQCPTHGDHDIPVFVDPPFDDGPTADTRCWARTGDTWDTLTLTPSIDVPGCWHGFITDGEVTL